MNGLVHTPIFIQATVSVGVRFPGVGLLNPKKYTVSILISPDKVPSEKAVPMWTTRLCQRVVKFWPAGKRLRDSAKAPQGLCHPHSPTPAPPLLPPPSAASTSAPLSPGFPQDISLAEGRRLALPGMFENHLEDTNDC